MRKYKCNPPKSGYYVAWYNGSELNLPWLPTTHPNNLKYWDGTRWYNDAENGNTLFMTSLYEDRWSYIPKEKSKC